MCTARVQRAATHAKCILQALFRSVSLPIFPFSWEELSHPYHYILHSRNVKICISEITEYDQNKGTACTYSEPL